jgi:hypothetical protein
MRGADLSDRDPGDRGPRLPDCDHDQRTATATGRPRPATATSDRDRDGDPRPRLSDRDRECGPSDCGTAGPAGARPRTCDATADRDRDRDHTCERSNTMVRQSRAPQPRRGTRRLSPARGAAASGAPQRRRRPLRRNGRGAPSHIRPRPPQRGRERHRQRASEALVLPPREPVLSLPNRRPIAPPPPSPGASAAMAAAAGTGLREKAGRGEDETGEGVGGQTAPVSSPPATLLRSDAPTGTPRQVAAPSRPAAPPRPASGTTHDVHQGHVITRRRPRPRARRSRTYVVATPSRIRATQPTRPAPTAAAEAATSPRVVHAAAPRIDFRRLDCPTPRRAPSRCRARRRRRRTGTDPRSGSPPADGRGPPGPGTGRCRMRAPARLPHPAATAGMGTNSVKQELRPRAPG